VKVEFHDKRLAKKCIDERSRVRAFGRERAKKLTARLSSMLAAADLEVLRHAPGRFHELFQDRAGQFSADLDGPYRLIFAPVLTTEEQAQHVDGFVWSKITRVSIVEITDTHA